MSRESISLAHSELKAFFALHSAPRLNLCVYYQSRSAKNKTKPEMWLQCVLVLKCALVCIIIVQVYFNSWFFPVFLVRVGRNKDLPWTERVWCVAAAEGPGPCRAPCYWDALGTVTLAWCLQHAPILQSSVTSRAASWFTPTSVLTPT